MSYLVGQITLNQRESGQESLHTEPLGYTDYNILDKSQTDTQVVATALKNFAVAVSGLTTNTYIDGIIRYDASLNEEVGE